jgi:hypothetical protein
MAGGFTIIAGGLAILAAIAPWATSEGPFSENGLALGDGWISAGLGALLIGLGALATFGRPARWIRSATLALAAAELVLGVAENAKLSGVIASLGPTVHLGLGIYLLGVASVAALLAAWRGGLLDPGVTAAG